jgi:glucosylceramidase
MNKFMTIYILYLLAVMTSFSCQESAIPTDPDEHDTIGVKGIDLWMTTKDETSLLERQNVKYRFNSPNNFYEFIEVDSAIQFQTVDGFGYTFTGGSAKVLNRLSPYLKQQLLEELFGKKGNSIGVSYLRLSIGASDLNDFSFSYNDLESGETDLPMENFTLSHDLTDLIPLLKEVKAINPEIRFLATPWSAPTWMKDNKSFKGGRLLPQYYDVYARYFVKYITEMAKHGILIDAVTPQNEPLHPGNNPSMYMIANEQADFIKNHLGPEFRKHNLQTKIIIYDHNCDRPDYPKMILDDPDARDFVDGTAFHLYAGDIGVLSYLHDQFPQKNLYFTEQYTASDGNFGGDLHWHIKNVIVGSMRNWSRIALEWNLANDGNFGPHTDGGCTTCKGAVTVLSADAFARNVSYYIIAHASKFVPPNSVRISSNLLGGLPNVAFLTPEGKKVLIVLNEGNGTAAFNIKYKGQWAACSLESGAVGTFVWD